MYFEVNERYYATHFKIFYMTNGGSSRINFFKHKS